MAKIAVDIDRAVAQRIQSGTAGRTDARVLTHGAQWSVADVVCTCGPGDRPFEERHDQFSIALVAAGSFQYRSTSGAALMTPGALMLGAAGQCFECGHEHAAGDRCVAFRYAPGFFDAITGGRGFRRSHLPPVRELSRVAARAAAGATLGVEVAWEETAVELAATAARLTGGASKARNISIGAMRRVTDTVRRIEADPAGAWSLSGLASEAGQSPFQYLRAFQQVTGVTPHQFVLRARLRSAALQLLGGDEKVIAVALGAGFGDVSNFNAAFKREFGVAPRAYRRAAR